MFLWRKVLFISIFNHWLNEQEADECPILCYSIAQDCDDLLGYLKGEQQFLNFYQSLDVVAHIIYDNNIKIINTKDDKYIEILKNGLREISPFKILLPTVGIMIESGYDRTDRIIIGENSNINFLKNMIKFHKLYVIDEMHYNEYIDNLD